MGPNGSGKSTLLSLIFGDNPQAYANTIFLFGKRKGSGESIWDIKRRIGFIAPELHAYYPRRFTGFDTVCSGFFDSIGLYRQCTLEQKETASWWMNRLELGACADRIFSSLSESEQRMVLMARALVKHPHLLILDEPCHGLDAENRKRILGIIDAVATHLETTVIFVTHIPDEIPRVITHRLMLENEPA